jgi:hypothetical protein
VEAPGRHLNPFDDYIVTDPWRPGGVDVPQIHANAFALCGSALDYVRETGKSTSVLLHGAIGSGKTHLLGRLRNAWAGASSGRNDLPAREIVFVVHRFAPSPAMIWRQLRRSFVDDLLRGDGKDDTQLHRIVLRQLARVRPADGHLPHWWDWMREAYAGPGELDRQLDELFEQLDDELGLGRNLCTVLGHLFQNRRRRDARDWLRGAALPEETLTSLGLAGELSEDEEQEDQAREVIKALCRLTGPNHPVVMCFDQIEALQVHPNDKAGLFAFGQLVGTLHDQTSNVLLISCVQSNFYITLREFVSGPNYARLTKQEGALDLLTWDQAVRLVQSRLDSVPALARDRAAHPSRPLWPLPESDLKARLGNQACTARQVLSLCAQLMGAPPAPALEEFLARTWKERLDQAAGRLAPEQTDSIIAEGLPLLLHLAEKHWKQASIERERDLDLMLEGSEGRVGVSLCNHGNMRSLAARLRRLRGQNQDKKLQKLIIVRSPHQPISKNAKAARGYLDDLIGQGAQELRPSDEALAALDVLRGLLADAKSGDLANAGENVSPATVQEWLAANLPMVLRDFLEDVVSFPQVPGQGEADDKLFDDLVALLADHHVMPLDQAAAEVQTTREKVEECARRHGEEIGLLQGPPGVVFQRAGTAIKRGS